MSIWGMSVWEILMLLCFGASWPFNLAKTWRQKSAAGKSLAFLGLIALGYVFGIIHKASSRLDGVLALWIATEIMVSADLLLCLYYRRREKRSAQGPVKK